jgi:hypothetical protein
MDWSQAVTLARTLMNEHGLSHVPFVESNAKRQFGVTTHKVTCSGLTFLSDTKFTRGTL